MRGIVGVREVHSTEEVSVMEMEGRDLTTDNASVEIGGDPPAGN